MATKTVLTVLSAQRSQQHRDNMMVIGNFKLGQQLQHCLLGSSMILLLLYL
jgi:hypothetical protein